VANETFIDINRTVGVIETSGPGAQSGGEQQSADPGSANRGDSIASEPSASTGGAR
jgi:hypothetical protein